jgi:hypothetical protein
MSSMFNKKLRLRNVSLRTPVRCMQVESVRMQQTLAALMMRFMHIVK